MSDDLASWLRVQLDADEKRLRGGWCSGTHWQILRTRLRLGSWTVSRESGVDAALNDRIAEAGLAFMRELFDQWQADHATARLAEVDAKRRTLERHAAYDFPYNPDDGPGDYAWTPFCTHCGQPWPCPDLRDVAAPYAGRPGWQDKWAVA